jgi:hypothetical protein
MKRWVFLGGTLIAAVWLPYLYAELSSAPAEKKGRQVAEPDATEHAVVAEPGSSGHSADVDKPPTAPEPTPEPAPEPEPTPPLPTQPAVPPQPAFEQSVRPSAEQGPEQAAPGAAPVVPGAGEEPPPPPKPPGMAGPIDVLKHAYETQARDALWASDTEKRIGAMFGTKEVPAEMLTAASCRTAVCRIELRWTTADAQAFLGVHERLSHDFSEIGIQPIPAAEDEPDHHRVDLYLARKGFTVSDLAK